MYRKNRLMIGSNKHIVLHIPHSSTVIPFTAGFVADKAMIRNELEKLTDWYVDELFDQNGPFIPVITPFSRIFCDVERFRNDEDEPMAKFGMGVYYTLCDDGKPLRNASEHLQSLFLKDYYDKHHNLLTELVDDILKNSKYAFIVDCHSFPAIPLNRDLNKETPRPDFNIGTDAFHTPPSFIEISKEYFSKLGYNVGINWPYSGTIVPEKYLRKDARVLSIMLEVNRDLYLIEGTTKKNEKFDQIKKVIAGWLDIVGRL
jgi:N-formylglutamate amidohydrolase